MYGNITASYNLHCRNCISVAMFTSNFVCGALSSSAVCTRYIVQCANNNDKSLCSFMLSLLFSWFLYGIKKKDEANEYHLFAMHSFHSCLCCSLTNGKTVPKLHSNSSSSPSTSTSESCLVETYVNSACMLMSKAMQCN